MDPRLERQAKNEALFRAVNREIENASEEVGARELEVLCECGEDGCNGVIEISVDAYDSVHQQRDRFLLLPGHESPTMERVVDATDAYVVVDKFGDAEEVVEREDAE